LAAVLREPRHRTEIWDEHDATPGGERLGTTPPEPPTAPRRMPRGGKTVARSLPATHVGPGTARRVVALSDEPPPAPRRTQSSS